MKKLIYCILLVGFFIALNSVETSSKQNQTITILPIEFNGIDSISVKTSEMLLKLELEKNGYTRVVTSDIVMEKCEKVQYVTNDQMIEVGNKLETEKVIFLAFNKLGDRIIVQYKVLNCQDSRVTVLDNISAASVEDLENVMKRIATMTLEEKSFEESATVDNIIDKETFEPNRRKAIKHKGITFGYLYPTNGYDDVEKSLTIDYRIGFEMKKNSVGLNLAIRRGFAANVYYVRLLSNKDFCPYIGGAFGFHAVGHDDDRDDEGSELRSDGFEVGGTAGIRMFRTYNFTMIANLDYTLCFNDYDDQAVIFTVGLLF